MAINKGNDHWAFLERIEAPMWVDLMLEASSNNQDVDEEWFQTTHPIHQSSSNELKSAVTVSGEEDMIVDYGLEGPSSPKSTHSVSRSRGSEYKSKKWRENGFKSFSKKQHLVEKMDSKKTSETFSRVVHEISSRQNSKENYSKPIPSSSSSRDSLNCKVEEAITSVNNRGSEKNFQEVSRLEINKDGRFLEFLKISLRKRDAARNPSRVEANNNGRESNGSKSLSDKSSVSSYCDHGIKSATVSSRIIKERTPDSKDVVKMNQAIKSKAKVANTSKTSTFQVDKSRRIDKTRPMYQEAAKSKVISNGRDSSAAATKGVTKAKAGVSGLNAGKENARGKMVVDQSTIGRPLSAQGILWVQKGTKQTSQQKDDKTGSLHFKGKFNDQNEKKATNAGPHFR